MKKTACTACYIRVSTYDQQSGKDSQKRALQTYTKNHGIKGVAWYEDTTSGSTLVRPAFEKLQKDIFAGKIERIIVWRLDRISRSLKDGVTVLHDWCEKGIEITSLTEGFNLAGPMGQLFATLLIGLAQMERSNLIENTKRGLAAARARGKRLGPKPKLQSDDVLALRKAGLSLTEIGRRLGSSRQAVHAALKRFEREAKEAKTA